MGWSLLGDVNDGWFAQLAHGVERVGTAFGLGPVYREMDVVIPQRVAAINQEAINQALARGATPSQALGHGSEAMDSLVNPHSVTDYGVLLGTATTSAASSVSNVISRATTPDVVGGLMPLLIGAGALGLGYLGISAFSGSGSTAPARRTNQQRQN